MGMAMEVIGARATNPGAGPAACAASTGDTLAIRSFDLATPAYLLNVWGQEATAGFVQIRSPRLHDNVRGIRTRILAATTRAELGYDAVQHLYPQDTLTVECAGGAAETDAFGMLIYYQDAPGMAARLATWEQVLPRIVQLLSIETTMVAPAVAGDWGAGVALNAAATGDLTKANTDYAVLGYLTDTACTSVGIVGPDTGNVRVGGPGGIEPIETRDWFKDLARSTGMPCIPIINSANKGATLVQQQNNAAAGTPIIDLMMAELRPVA